MRSAMIARGLALLLRGRAEMKKIQGQATPELPWMHPLPPEGTTLEQRKVSFYERNPAVKLEIVRRLREKIAMRLRPSVYAVVENMREEYAAFTIDDEHPFGKHYKLNNNFTAYYNNRIPQEFPEFQGRLVQRKRQEA